MNSSLSDQKDHAFQFDEKWIVWLEHNLSLSVPHDRISAAMIADGCPEAVAESLVKAFAMRKVATSPQGNQRLAKVHWLLDSLRSLQSLPSAQPLAERDALNYEEFVESFYAVNLPVVYRNCLSPASLSDQLSWERLDREIGSLEVEVQEGRSQTTDFERQSPALKSKCRLSEFLKRSLEAEESNDFYMTANNASSNAALIDTVIDPATVCPEILNASTAAGKVFLWIGPQGTFTPSHHDLTNNLFLQVKGSKKFRLASSLALLDMDNDSHCYSSSSLSDLDERRSKDGLPPISFTVTLEEGDVLFLPLGWWHEVTGLSPSISLSATNFRAKNDYHLAYHFYGKLDA